MNKDNNMSEKTTKQARGSDTLGALVLHPASGENIDFFRGEVLVGKMCRTFHPSIKFEVFNEPTTASIRVNSAEEAEAWLLSDERLNKLRLLEKKL